MNLDGTLKTAARISGLNCLWSWYPFKRDCNILIAGSGYENDFDSLKKHTSRIDEYKNISANKERKYDYVILSDYGVSSLKDKKDYYTLITDLKSYMKSDGKFLMAVNNRIGVRYLCGEPDDTTGMPFDNISENNGAYRFSRNELERFLSEFDFGKIKFYYPIPDCITPRLVYTDDYHPTAELCERLSIYIQNEGSRVLNEEKLFQYLAENDELLTHANSFLVECGTEVSDILYCSMTPNRKRENALVTIIHEDTVEKIPMYSEGVESLNNLYRNLSEMKKRGVPVLDVELNDGKASMRRVKAVPLSQYIKSIERNDLIKCLEKMYSYILMSSEHVDAGRNKMLFYDKTADWGPILKTAYIEMLPVNCFYENNDFLFFDQEYTINNCPAKYVLFRTINDIHKFAPETEKIISADELKEHFGITELWDHFVKEETTFWAVRSQMNNNILRDFIKHKNNDYSIKQNRKVLQMNNKVQKTTEKSDDCIFDLFGGLEEKKLILFGAGKISEYFMDKYGEKYPPEFIIDNDPNKWGQTKFGLSIFSPDKLKEINIEKYRVIISSGGIVKMSGQLEQMGISSEHYRVYNNKVDELIPAAISNTLTEGKYNVGYVTGAFDLFHIGHLNILKRCKERCHYLIAGVLTDEIIRDEKHKEPFIAFDERIEIVKQCKYVDRVVPIDKHNTNKIDAWRELRYGCLFAGGDHETEAGWLWLQRQLRALGSELEFFPYTQSTSSTMLQKVIRGKIGE